MIMPSDTTRRTRSLASVVPMRVPRDLLPTQIGAYAEDERIVEPGRATPLCKLPGGEGRLLVSRDLAPVLVRDVDDGFVDIFLFSERTPGVWATLHALWPGARPGERFPRFWVAYEPPEGGYPGVWGLLDLGAMDVLVRGPRAQMEHLVARANAEPEVFLGCLAISEVTRTLRDAEPKVAGVIAEQIWASWQRRIE